MTSKLGEKYYKKKGIITKVEDHYQAVVKMIDTNDKIRLDQSHVETVIPTIGKSPSDSPWERWNSMFFFFFLFCRKESVNCQRCIPWTRGNLRGDPSRRILCWCDFAHGRQSLFVLPTEWEMFSIFLGFYGWKSNQQHGLRRCLEARQLNSPPHCHFCFWCVCIYKLWATQRLVIFSSEYQGFDYGWKFPFILVHLTSLVTDSVLSSYWIQSKDILEIAVLMPSTGLFRSNHVFSWGCWLIREQTSPRVSCLLP